MHKETNELLQVQESCSDFLQIMFDKMNRKPVKPVHTLHEVYLNQFININEQQLKGIYNDRQRNIRRMQRSKASLRGL